MITLNKEIYIDPVKLTMQERINQLRKEKKWTMEDIERMTGISTSSQQRYETNPSVYIPYQNLMQLAELYEVSMDYMCGLTLHRKYREMPIDELALTDGSVDFLRSNTNVRLINELLSYKDLPDLLTAIEIFVAGKITAGANDMNAVFSIAEATIKSKIDIDPQDETMALLRQAQIDHNEYLRFRITERFNTLLKEIYEERKQTNEELSISVSDFMKQNLDDILKDKHIKEKDAFYSFAKILGMPTDEIPEEKMQIFQEVIKMCDLYKLMNEQSAVPLSREQRRKLKKDGNKKK